MKKRTTKKRNKVSSTGYRTVSLWISEQTLEHLDKAVKKYNYKSRSELADDLLFHGIDA